MVNLLLISHGPFCEGLLKSLEMITGPQKSIQVLPLYPGQSPDDYRLKLEQTLSTLTGDTIVFCDLKGGTPYNTAAMLKRRYSFHLITGMNLPMLITAVTMCASKVSANEVAKEILSPVSQGIELVDLTNGGKKHAKLSLDKN